MKTNIIQIRLKKLFSICQPMEDESICFYDQNFLAQNQLSKDNIMQYFSFSPFYDKNSLNEILKMQSQFANIDISDKLTTLRGFYYIVEDEKPDLFIIARRNNNGSTTTTTRMYYCMYGYIYCAPTVKSISDARMIDTLLHFNKALDKYEEMKSFDWIKGFEFRRKEDKSKKSEEDIKFVLEALHDFELKYKELS